VLLFVVGSLLEDGGDALEALAARDARGEGVAVASLALAGEGLEQVLSRLGKFEVHGGLLCCDKIAKTNKCCCREFENTPLLG
jgi:hypothetical protein